jgi:hypothetical protein
MSDEPVHRSVADARSAIALEVSPDNGGEKVTTWRCLLYGDVFELAPTGYSPDEDIFLTPLSTTPGQGLDLVGAYRAPKTFKYRQLNAAGMEVTCDIIGAYNPFPWKTTVCADGNGD